MVLLFVINYSVRIGDTMDNLRVANFSLGKEKEINHHIWKGRAKIIKIARFS